MTENATVSIDSLPISADDFRGLQGRLGGTPEGGAALLVLALVAWTQDRTLGEEYVALAVDPDRTAPAAGRPGRVLRARDLALLRSQLGRMPHVPYSYLLGSTPANRYRMPEVPLQVFSTRNPYSGDDTSGRVKVFVASSGADSPRPVTLTRGADGVWRAREWSSLLSGVREPERF